MPLPAILAPIIMGASGLIGAGLAARASKKRSTENMQMQYWQNKENWRQTREMYAMQRSDALADWERENAYNSPEQQMTRLRQAGLNPHLVYGKGADATAGSIRSSTFNPVNRPAPQNTFDPATLQGIGNAGAGAVMGFYDLKAKQAQTDNVNQNTALQQQEVLFKQANTAKTLQDTARSKFDLEQANALKDSVIEQAKLNNEKSRADIQFTLDENQRKALSNTTDLKLTLEKIITEKIAHSKDTAQIELYRKQLQQIRQNMDINSYEQELSRMGIHKSDPWYFRAVMNLVEGNMEVPDVSGAANKYWNQIKSQWNRLTGKNPGASGGW